MDEIYSVLKQCQLFDQLEENVIAEVVKKARLETYPTGTKLLIKGEAPSCLFIIKHGKVGIFNEDVLITEIGELAIMGESLIAGKTATATTVALTALETVVIGREDFQHFISEYPRILLNIFIISNNRQRMSNNAALDAARMREEKLQQMVAERTHALNATLDELQVTQKYREQFLANMSHEIRTPMSAVMGMTNLVLSSPLNNKQRFYLDGIKKSSEILLHIINDILDFSKISAGKMELEDIDFSLHELVKQVRRILQQKAGDKGLELITTIDKNVDDVLMGDPVRLNQVLMNLAGNAIKFTETGSVTLAVEKIDAGIKFTVSDTGIGIPADKIESVFESFSQANASDTRIHGGTGLGLTISRDLVRLMGGTIAVESHEGFGSTFSFVVPLESGSAERLQERIRKEESPDGSVLNALSILVVDDNEFNRVVAIDTLEKHSTAKVVAAENAKLALQLLRENKFDVVLMDIQMPIINGYEATRQIRENFTEPFNNIPIIALTASTMKSDLDKCLAAGMNGYIAKPFKVAELITGIATVLKIKVPESSYTPPVEVKKTVGSTGRITDLTYLNKFCEGDTERMKKYILMFEASAPLLIEKLKHALLENDRNEIANQVHSFKTKWIMMGMREAGTLSTTIEQKCRMEDHSPSVEGDIRALIRQIEQARVELKSQEGIG